MAVNRGDRISGCLFGGAIGDALGYAVEFDRMEQIKKKYGEDGISDFLLHNGKAYVSDDTQMTLFTAASLIHAREAKQVDESVLAFIWDAYKDWYHTQVKNGYRYTGKTFLYERQELHARRAPGGTCLESLRKSKYGGSIEEPINASKGCGGVMRVAPIGLIPLGKNGLIGAKAAALTHDHPLGYIPAFYLADLIHLIMEENDNIEALINRSLRTTEAAFKENAYTKEFVLVMERAICCAKDKEADPISIKRIGEGWTGEEAMAIAVYASLKYQEDFKKAIICAVNHDGDSDSTAAITGNILGAYLGINRVKESYDIKLLDLYNVICEVSERLKEQTPG